MTVFADKFPHLFFFSLFECTNLRNGIQERRKNEKEYRIYAFVVRQHQMTTIISASFLEKKKKDMEITKIKELPNSNLLRRHNLEESI